MGHMHYLYQSEHQFLEDNHSKHQKDFPGEEMLPPGELYIFNAAGDLVWSQTLEKSPGLTIHLDITPGVYSVLLRAHSGESYIAKLVRQ